MGFELKTNRLLLRQMDLQDLEFMYSMLSHPDVMRYYPKQLSRLEVKDWIKKQCQRYENDGHGLWLALLKNDLTPLGQVGLVSQKIDGDSLAEIGYMIHHSYWRNGFAFEAANAVKLAANQIFEYEKVISLVRPENNASSSLALKLNMQKTKECTHGGFPHDMYQFNYMPADIRVPH